MPKGLLNRVEAAFRLELFVNHYGSFEIYTFTVEQRAATKPGSASKAGINQRILLMATMLEARTANLMTLAAFLPRKAARADMRYQWIARFIDNHRVDCDAVMEPFACAVLAKAAESGRIVLIMDQTKASKRHQV
jgi:hypothetical protein